MPVMYRVHKDGVFDRGLYRSNVSAKLMDTRGRHPNPYNDSKLLENGWEKLERDATSSLYYFGFGTLEQFSNWIYNSDWWKELDAEGFVISKIESPDVIYGYTQAVFKKCDLVETGLKDTWGDVMYDRVDCYRIIKTVKVSEWKELDV